MLEVLKKNNFTLNLTKCEFFQTAINYLGREISVDGVRPGTNKIKAVIKAAEPTDIKELRSFLGLVSYFRKFIEDLSKIVAPLTDLLRKVARWKWASEQANAVRKLKCILTDRAILAIFDRTLETEVHTDASSIGLGAILMQKVDKEKRVVAYYSRKTTEIERKYHSYDLETLAVVEALKTFRVYLFGIKFNVFKDCSTVRATAVKRDIQPRVECGYTCKTMILTSSIVLGLKARM